MEREPVSVTELVQWTLIRFAVPESVKVTLRLPNDLPEIFVDMGQMQQVLGNLITNAYQAMSKGGSLTISAGRRKGMVTIAVKDTGVGIPPENMSILFEPLFTTKAKGIRSWAGRQQEINRGQRGAHRSKKQAGKGFHIYAGFTHPGEVNNEQIHQYPDRG